MLDIEKRIAEITARDREKRDVKGREVAAAANLAAKAVTDQHEAAERFYLKYVDRVVTTFVASCNGHCAIGDMEELQMAPRVGVEFAFHPGTNEGRVQVVVTCSPNSELVNVRCCYNRGNFQPRANGFRPDTKADLAEQWLNDSLLACLQFHLDY